MTELTFTCDECGTDFPADPDCMVESFLSADHASPENWQGEPHAPVLSPEDREDAKQEMGITDEQLDTILAGGTVTMGACICKPCQDRMSEEDES